MLTRFETARILGARSLQISMGAPVLTKIPKTVNEKDPLEVARYELRKSAVPISVARFYPDGHSEVVEVE